MRYVYGAIEPELMVQQRYLGDGPSGNDVLITCCIEMIVTRSPISRGSTVRMSRQYYGSYD